MFAAMRLNRIFVRIRKHRPQIIKNGRKMIGICQQLTGAFFHGAARRCCACHIDQKCHAGIPDALSWFLPVRSTATSTSPSTRKIVLTRQHIAEHYDLTPKGIIESLGLRTLDHNLVSSHEHFGKASLTWELQEQTCTFSEIL